jgi:hypothetical protein
LVRATLGHREGGNSSARLARPRSRDQHRSTIAPSEPEYRAPTDNGSDDIDHIDHHYDDDRTAAATYDFTATATDHFTPTTPCARTARLHPD